MREAEVKIVYWVFGLNILKSNFFLVCILLSLLIITSLLLIPISELILIELFILCER